MAYPNSIDSFTNPAGTSTLVSPDHALQHTNTNTAITAIETVLGTTAGTGVLKNFAAGNFPARINVSNVLQQAIQGTINTSVLGTPAITGGTLGTATITGGTIASSVINNATLGSPAITGGTQTLPNIVTRTIGSAVYTGTVSTTQTLNLASATRHLVNMANSAGSVTLALSNVTANEPFVVEIKQGTAGLGTINWFSGISWSGSVSPTQTLTASRKDTFGFIATSGTSFDGYIVGQNL
jgi:hypothetical protein